MVRSKAIFGPMVGWETSVQYVLTQVSFKILLYLGYMHNFMQIDFKLMFPEKSTIFEKNLPYSFDTCNDIKQILEIFF